MGIKNVVWTKYHHVWESAILSTTKKRRIVGMWDIFTNLSYELEFKNISSNPKVKSSCRILEDMKRNIVNSINISYFMAMNNTVSKSSSLFCAYAGEHNFKGWHSGPD